MPQPDQTLKALKSDFLNTSIILILIGILLTVLEILEVILLRSPQIYVLTIIITALIVVIIEYKRRRNGFITFKAAFVYISILIIIILLFLFYIKIPVYINQHPIHNVDFKTFSLMLQPYITFPKLLAFAFITTFLFFMIYFVFFYVAAIAFRYPYNLVKRLQKIKEIQISDLKNAIIVISIILLISYVEYQSQITTTTIKIFNISEVFTLATGAIIAIMPLFLVGLMQLPANSINEIFTKKFKLNPKLKEIALSEDLLVKSFAAFLITIGLSDVANSNILQIFSGLFKHYSLTNLTSIIQWTATLFSLLFSTVYFFAFLFGVIFLGLGIYEFQKVFKEITKDIRSRKPM